MDRRTFLGHGLALPIGIALARAASAAPVADGAVIDISSPMPPPEWALLERALLDAHLPACEAFFRRYYDERGFLLEHERWGGDDGPDDAIENVNDWPQLYALGASEHIREMYEKAYDGHVRQYTLARTTQVPFARDGMYYREFPVMMDWQHNAEGLTVFNNIGLGNPYDKTYRDRVRRFAGFYTGKDPSTPNYDPQHRLIRSMFNGSRGPLMRKATALDWAGDPIDTAGVDPASLLHGEGNYPQMLAHFRDYTDTVGDNPLNLGTTALALNAYMLAHEPKYREWLLGYVDAWVDRARRNGDILPTNIGLDGSIGGEVGGKWYGGVYGWGFSPVVPQTGRREDRNRIPYCLPGFLNAFLVTGDDKYLDVWRRMADRINANAKVVDGQLSSPTMHGDDGWYSYKPGKWSFGSQDIYYLSMKPSDRARMPDHPWISYLEGRNPGYPVATLRSELDRIRSGHAALLADQTTPDTRFADTVMDQNPAQVTGLLELMEGGIHIGRPGWSRQSPNVGGAVQFVRFRYFDPLAGRPGMPPDVAALVEALGPDSATLLLVNVSPVQPRTVVVQGGAYGEHQIVSVSDGPAERMIGRSSFTVQLAPGAGARLMVRMRRYANQPTLDFPWVQASADDRDRSHGRSALLPTGEL